VPPLAVEKVMPLSAVDPDVAACGTPVGLVKYCQLETSIARPPVYANVRTAVPLAALTVESTGCVVMTICVEFTVREAGSENKVAPPNCTRHLYNTIRLDSPAESVTAKLP
jgi:hypothetical protein